MIQFRVFLNIDMEFYVTILPRGFANVSGVEPDAATAVVALPPVTSADPISMHPGDPDSRFTA
jgi:hypothetical protein